MSSDTEPIVTYRCVVCERPLADPPIAIEIPTVCRPCHDDAEDPPRSGLPGTEPGKIDRVILSRRDDVG